MLKALSKTYRGRTTVIMVDTLSKVLAKKTQLQASQRKGIRGSRVVYTIDDAPADAEKQAFKPHDMYLGGGLRKHPRVPRK